MATFPSRPLSFCSFAGFFADFRRAEISASAALSMRLMKKLAPLAMRPTFPQAACLFDSALSITREVRRHFQADIAITLVGFLIDRAQQVSRILNVANGDDFVTGLGVEIGAVL